MPGAAEVICDASVVLKWFHAEGEDEVGESRALLDLQTSGAIALLVLDLTAHEVGNALVRGIGVPASAAQAVLEALALACESVAPSAGEIAHALSLTERHDLTLYDAVYAAVAESRHAELATLDRALLEAGLGRRPSELVVGR
jgi:predicted nucleic acid-binding protein